MVSMEDELESFSPGMTDWYIEGLKTVYANDSICLLQCTARFHDAKGEKKMWGLPLHLPDRHRDESCPWKDGLQGRVPQYPVPS